MTAFGGVVVYLISLLLTVSVAHSKIQKMDLEKIKDPDFRRVNDLVKGDWLAVEEHRFRDLNGKTWTLQVHENRNRPAGPSWFVPHDSENDAYVAGIYAIKKYGGVLLSFECGERRFCNGVDPNRYFKRKNRVYVDYIMNFFRDERFPVLTLHNNHNGHRKTRGLGAINAKVKQPYKNGWATYNSGDDDDLIIFADHRPKEISAFYKELSDIFDLFKLNYIFELISHKSKLQGHMSHYVVENTKRGYFNIEAQHRHTEQQKMYVDKLMKIIGHKP